MPYTGEQKREYDRQWRASRRLEFFKDKCCAKCGSIDRLELDHIDPNNKISHNVWSWSEQRRSEELAKCQVLCYDCHKLKSSEYFKEIYFVPLSEKKHGTNNTYNREGCRCSLCVEWRSSKYKRLGT